MTSKAYFDFIIETNNLFPEIDLSSRALLDEIVFSESLEKDPLSVTKAMNMIHIASPATLYRKLDDLVAFGYIEHRYQEGNNRTKYLYPTRKALDSYEWLGKAIKRAAK